MANDNRNISTSNSGNTTPSMDKVGTQKDKIPTKKLSHGSNLNESDQIKDNAKKIHDLAGAAAKSPHPAAATAGKAVQGLDKLTGGKASEALSKPVTALQNKIPEPVKKAADIANPNRNNTDSRLQDILARKRDNNAPVASNNDNEDNKKKNNEKGGDQEKGSLPSSNSNKKPGIGNRIKNALGGNDASQETGEEQKSETSGYFQMSPTMKKVVIAVMPFALIMLLFISLITTFTSRLSDYDDAFGISMFMGEDTGGEDYDYTKEQEEFYERIKEVKEEYQASGKSVDALKVVSVFHSIDVHDSKFDYEDIDKSRIREVADLMFENNSYNEEKFKERLQNEYFLKYFPNSSESTRELMVEEVFEYIERYYDLIDKNTAGSTCASIGSCTYDVKGFNIPENGTNIPKGVQISDLKVRLMQCGGSYGTGSYTTPIDQDLVNFEDYVAGVAYAEIGDGASLEEYKAQMLVARSFALTRSAAMGNGLGKKLEQENGQWILQISSCVADQVFCNIDLGCTYMGGGDGQGGYVISGVFNDRGIRTRPPLPADHPIRQAAAETQGQVAVDSKGYIVYTNFAQKEQNKFKNLASSGLDYKQIIMQMYGSVSDIQQSSCNDGSSSSNCVGSTGEFAKWKQYEGDWANTVYVGGSGRTIHEIGCLATSVSMLVAKSGVPVNVDPLNPGTFVSYLNDHNGFDSRGNFQWASVSNVAPTFKFVGKVELSGMTREQKLAKINELVNQPNTYVVAEVMGGNAQHWVAIDGVNGNNVIMMDPGSSSTDLWSKYNWENTSTLAYFKVG